MHRYNPVMTPNLSLVFILQLVCVSMVFSHGPEQTGGRARPVEKKLQRDLSKLDLSQMDFTPTGDGSDDSFDFICDNFCPEPESDPCSEPAVTNTDLLEEVETLKELVAAQTAAVEALKAQVQSQGAAGTDLIPLEYRPAYPVFLVESDYGHYQFTLAQARQACEEKGAQLASYKQMVAAWERGMDMCSCGWIDEGYALYPIWYARDGCTDKIGPGIRYNCTWQSTWNAWCFSKDIANKEA